MKYSPDWDLRSIPDELILSEASRIMHSRKKRFAGGVPVQETPDDALAERRRKKREQMRAWRKRQKENSG